MTAPLPKNEDARLRALHECHVLDTPPEDEFEEITRLAAHICGVPIAAVSLVDAERQWFKSIVGLPVTETPRDVAFCAHTILRPDVMVVPDAQADLRFVDNPLVTGDPSIRFYAGAPLVTEDGHALGSLCVIDRTPRHLLADQQEALRLLARLVTSQLERSRRAAEREKAGAERLQSEAERLRLAAIIETSDDAIYTLTCEGRITSWNRGAERLYGYAAAEMVGKGASVLAGPGEQSPVPAAVTRLLRGGTVEPMEVARVRRDGTRFHAALSFSPLRDAAGHLIGLSCIARDITARKQAETALAETNTFLAESEARLRRLTDAAFEGIAVSQDGALVDVSPAFAALFGYADPAEMVGLAAGLLPAPASLALVLQKIADCDEGLYEATLRRRDDSTFQAEIRGRMIRLGGRAARVTAVRDITQRRTMEEDLRASHSAIRESEARLAEAQRVAKVGSWEYDLVADKVAWSDELFRLFGLDPAGGQPGYAAAVALYHPEDSPALDALVARAAREGIGFELDLRGAPDAFPDGRMRWYHAAGSADKDEAGRVVRLMGILADITERKQVEEALRESAAALEESQRFAHNVAESSASQIYVFDLDTGANLYANRGLAEFWGYSQGEIETLGGDLMAHIIHPDDMPFMLNHGSDFAHLPDGEVMEFETRCRHADGGWRWVWNREVVFERHPDGRPRRILGNAQDVTRQKELESSLREQAEQLRRSAATLRAVLESAPIILYAADAAGTVTLSEGTGLASLGLKPGEAVGRSVFDYSGEPEAEANTRRALAGEAVSYDAHVYGLSLHTELRPLRDADGTLAGLIGVCFDVTERVASEERFRVLFERSSDAHLLVGAGGIIDCNNAAVALLRCADKAQLLSLHPSVLSPEAQPDGRLSREKGHAMEDLARQNGFHRFEWTHHRMDGEEFPTEVALTPVTLADQPVMLAVLHDLTDRKRAEETARDHAVVLEFQKLALEAANAELEALATTDGMTGLKNHRAFQEQLAVEVSRAGRYHMPLSLILLDVDHFKGFNDAFGHPAGDAVLKNVAHILQAGARETDLVARYGGEEFILLLPQTDAAGAALFAERLRASIEAAHWPLRAVTASFGVACLRPGIEDGGSFIARADAALYLSKSGGRNRVTASGPPALSMSSR